MYVNVLSGLRCSPPSKLLITQRQVRSPDRVRKRLSWTWRWRISSINKVQRPANKSHEPNMPLPYRPQQRFFRRRRARARKHSALPGLGHSLLRASRDREGRSLTERPRPERGGGFRPQWAGRRGHVRVTSARASGRGGAGEEGVPGGCPLGGVGSSADEGQPE